VTACTAWARSAGPAPDSWATPQHPGGAELGDRDELLVGRGVTELDEPQGISQADPRSGEDPQIRCADGQAEAQLGGVAGTRVVRHRAVDDQRAGAEIGCQLRDVGDRRGATGGGGRLG